MTQVIEAPAVEPAPPAIEPRILARREQVARQRHRRRLRVAASAGAVVVVVGGGWLALHSPVLAARHVTVIGAVHTPAASVVAAVGLDGQPLVDVNTGQAAARVEALPWVAHATVARHWPDDVTVTVTERVPVAVVDDGGHAVLVDGSGHVLATVFGAPPSTVVLAAPVVVARPGSVLGAGAAPGLAVLGAVPTSLRARLQQVDVAADGDVTLALTGNVGVTLGPAVELGAKFAALASVLTDVPPTAPEVIDVTVPDAPAVGPPPPPGGARSGPRPTAPPVHSGGASRAPQVRLVRRGPS